MRKTIFSTGQEKLRELLRQSRLEAGYSQTALAERLKKPQSFVSKYESGERRLDLIELQQVCAAMDIPLLDFVKKFEAASR